MTTHDGPPHSAAPRRLQTTQWTLVHAARGAADGMPGARAAVAELSRIYWYPVYGFIRHKRSADQAADLTQEFFSRLIEYDSFGTADERHGRFRNWLFAAVKNFLANDWRHMSASKRDFRVEVRLDALDAEQRYALEPRHELSPDRLFERRLSLCFLSDVFETLRRECEADAMPFDQLACFVPGGELDAHAYDSVAQALGIDVNALKQRVHRLRKRYARIFHRSMRELVEHEQDIADEIRFMIQALDVPEG